jgi:tripartite-type tricarboxylate transporter receptor subunit TctC
MLLVTLATSVAFGQTWPSKPVRVVIGFGAGGPTDAIVRLVADDLGKRLGQPFVVENYPGANGLIAARRVKASPPDGYTLYGGSATPFTPVFMKENLDAAKEFQPVSIMAVGDWFVFVRADLGVNSIQELAAKSKTTPLKYAYQSPADHSLMALIAKMVNFEFQGIPYKTTGEVVTSLLSGDTDFTLGNPGGFTTYIRSGKIRAVAALSPTRTPLLPNVPTLREQNVDFVNRFNMGVWAPVGTPNDVVSKLSAAISEAVKNPAVVEKISAISMIPTGSSPEELLRTFQTEMQAYQEAAKVVGLQPQ